MAPFLVFLDRVRKRMSNLDSTPLPVHARSGHGLTWTGLHAASVLTSLAGPAGRSGVLARRRKIAVDVRRSAFAGHSQSSFDLAWDEVTGSPRRTVDSSKRS